MAVLDVTVWPNNNTYLHHCIQMFNTVLSLSHRNIGFVLTPIPHAQTNQSALLKHQRLLEDQMVKAGLDVTRKITLLLDKRKISQPCLMVSSTTQGEADNEWFQSNAWFQQCIGPISIIKVSEMVMVGYDPDIQKNADIIYYPVRLATDPTKHSYSCFGIPCVSIHVVATTVSGQQVGGYHGMGVFHIYHARRVFKTPKST